MGNQRKTKKQLIEELDALGTQVADLEAVVRQSKREDPVRRSEAGYRALVEHATYGIYRSSVEGEFLAVNPALVEMLGYETKEELLAVRLDPYVYRDPEVRAALIERYESAGEIEGIEVEWQCKDGDPITVRLSGRPVYDQEGETECFEMIAEDVTERRKLEAHLRQAQKMEAVGQLTGGIAHDFKNILTIIMSSAEMVDGALPEGTDHLRADLDQVRRAARRGAEMVRKLLGFSRRDILTIEPLDLKQVVSEMTRMLKRLVPEHIEIQVIADGPVGTVLADPGAIEQTLLNLATNARDAMPDGGALTIDVRQVELDNSHRTTHPWVVPGEYVRIAVRDVGVGMDEETKEHIFEPFYTTKPEGKGSGLGMPMVYGLVKQHGGFVHVYSEKGEGTEVKLYFPVTCSEADTLEPAGAHQMSLPAGTETILVVEDEEPIRRSSVRALENHGYSVLEAKNGEEALEVFGAHESEIALIVSDLVMPKLGGRQLYEVLHQRGKKVRFLFTSGYSAIEVGEGFSLKPEIPFLHKPWALTDFLSRVREVLDQGASS